MDKPRVLSGEELVARGITKIDATLPELGLKDVIPNGSWLEQKQVQAALEARKYLIEVERIEKCGILSHAIWRDDLMLAEVTQMSGGHWQYLGHNIGKTIYLRPEETLFLMEVNCLLLKHNDVTVSLQKAYALLLRSPTTLVQYKVYASLSRLGYKVFRHKAPKDKPVCKKVSVSDNIVNPKNITENIVNTENVTDNIVNSVNITENIVNRVNVTVNVNSPKIITGNESESVEEKSPSSVNEVVNNNSSKDAPTEEFANVGSAIVETDTKSENIDSVMTYTVDIPLQTNQANEVRDSNDQDETNNKTSKYEDGQETVAKTDTQDNTVKVNESTIIMEIDNVGVNSADNASEDGQDNKQDVSSTVTERDNVQAVGSGVTLMEEDDSITDSMIGPAVPSVPDKISDITVNETVYIDLPKDAQTEVIGNVGSPIVETDIKSENIDPVMTNKAVDVTLQPNEANELRESNYQDVTNNETRKYEDGQETVTEIDTHIDTVKDNKSPIIMEIDNIGVHSAGDASEGQITNQEVTESDNVEAVGSGDNLMEEDDSITNNMISDSAVPREHGSENIDDNTKDNSDQSDNSNKFQIPQVLVNIYLTKIEKLNKRQEKPSDSKNIQKYFENIPDLYKKQLATVNVPEQEYIPKNIYVNKSSYFLNLHNIKRRSVRSHSNESASYTSSDEANETSIRRIRNTSSSENYHNLNFSPHLGFPRHHFRPYGFWRPQNNLNYYQFSMFFQRPSYSNMYIQSRVQYLPRPNHMIRSFSYPSNLSPHNPNICQDSRKRIRTGRTAHLQNIKNLAVRLKQFLMSGNTERHNLESLHNQLHSYNLRYKTRLRLTEHFDVVNEENILETIELEDDEESKSKKPRLEQDRDDKYDENLYRLRQLALRLRDLGTKDLRTATHKRAFSKALKTFNKSYNADMYLDDDSYEVFDRRCITVKSSSESDCVLEEKPKVSKRKGKKLRNPFNILKRRSERLQSLINPGTSTNAITPKEISRTESDGNKAYDERILTTFDKAWLPNESDFGRAEILPNRFMNARLIESNKEQYIFDFMKDQFQEYKNWLEAKTSFLKHLHETNIAFQNEQARVISDSKSCNSGLVPLINSGDNSDMPSVLKKLRIIKNNIEISSETSLSIDFDVYNRDVQNFRKTNPPKPHFRLICLSESSCFPSAAEVMALYSKYDDNVSNVFAVVGINSISYLQINPIDLPVYVPSNDVL